jgi:NDP-sugar pyrophosphorylase family protein
MNKYRQINSNEISALEKQHCSCSDWSKVFVSENFSTEHIQYCTFSGDIKLGAFNKEYTLDGNIKRHSGIYKAVIHNCQIGDDTYIYKTNNYIANYEIGSGCYIENIDILAVTEKSQFGNCTPVSALNEGGGREVPACDLLTAHSAYMMALYRHRPQLTKKLNSLFEQYAQSIASEFGHIGNNVIIRNCHIIKNVKIGDNATLEGCSELINGSINSNTFAPVYIGINVIAHNFVVSSGSEITEAAIIDRCFVGQGCQIGKQYSAADSLFFCNCQGFHGEAASIFAGPFTVTHHKSSLLIAGMFSFLNAGSGSNQSNHMYKLGPIHQGIVERGSKTTSDSYILWPAKIGAFTLVMGRHTEHSDTSDLPFSYLIEQDNETILVPGANLKSVGTIRDAQKWPKRDRRKDPNKLDQINFNLLSPYTIQKMMAGQEILQTLKQVSGETCETYYYQNTRIKNSSLRKGIDIYEMGISKFLGNSIINRLENDDFKNIDDIRKRLMPDTEEGLGDWLDISGLIAPRTSIDNIIKDVESEKISSLEELNDRFAEIHKNYYTLEWTWAIDKIQKRLGKSIEEITIDDIISIVENWKTSVITLDKILYEDAKKEFTLKVKTSFGVDGSEKEKQKDFEYVRGDFDQNQFVIEVQKHIEKKSELGNKIIAKLKQAQ